MSLRARCHHADGAADRSGSWRHPRVDGVPLRRVREALEVAAGRNDSGRTTFERARRTEAIDALRSYEIACCCIVLAVRAPVSIRSRGAATAETATAARTPGRRLPAESVCTGHRVRGRPDHHDRRWAQGHCAEYDVASAGRLSGRQFAAGPDADAGFSSGGSSALAYEPDVILMMNESTTWSPASLDVRPRAIDRFREHVCQYRKRIGPALPDRSRTAKAAEQSRLSASQCGSRRAAGRTNHLQ